MASTSPRRTVTICDVGPRDGLQNEPETLAVATRAELVSRLAAARLPRIEAVSFVRDDLVPQMAGAEEVVAAADRGEAELAGLVLNERGHERFAATPLDRLNVTLAVTETFNRRNANATLDEALAAGAVLASERAAFDRDRVVRVRLPVRGRGRPGNGRGPVRAAPRRRRARPRRHDRRRDAAPRPPARRARLDPRQAGRLPRPQHAQRGLRLGVGGARGRSVRPRRLGRRPRRLPFSPNATGNVADRGSRLAARARGRRDRRRPGRARRDGPLACRRARPRLDGYVHRAAGFPG